MNMKKNISYVLSFILTIGLLQFSGIGIDTAEAAQTDGVITPYYCEQFSDIDHAFNQGAEEVLKQSVKEVMQEKISDKSYLYTFTLKKNSHVYFKSLIKDTSEHHFNLFLNIAVYSDAALTDKLIETKLDRTNESYDCFVDLKEGTYYVQVIPDRVLNSHSMEFDFNIAVGAIPKSHKFIKIEKSTDGMTNKNITVTVKTNADTKQLWYEEGTAKDYLLGNLYYWTSDKKLEGKTFQIEKNGRFTVQLEDVYGNFYYETIKVTNIDKKKPVKPTVKTAKAGTSAIKGKAEKKVTVYVKQGSKTYVAKAGAKEFTVKTAKLKKGMTLKVWCKDAAGNKSAVLTYKVK